MSNDESTQQAATPVESGTSVAEHQQASPPAVAGVIYGRGMQCIDPGDVMLPRLQVDAKAGVFRDRITEEESREIVIIPLFFSKSRIYFYDEKRDDANLSEETILCRSCNSIVPTAWSTRHLQIHGLAAPADACMVCPFGAWGPAPKSEKPHCRVNYNLLCVWPGGVEPFVFSTHGTGLSAIKKMLSLLSRSKKDLWAASHRFTFEKAGEGTKAYCSLTHKGHEWLPEADLPLYESLYNEYTAGGIQGLIDLMGGGSANVATAMADPEQAQAAQEPEEEVPF